MITSLMAGFAFGYCVVDFVMNIYNKKQEYELLKSTIETER